MTPAINIFGKLPIVCINIILGYSGIVKHRRGEYFDQIQPDDPRYTKMKTLLEERQLYHEHINRDYTDVKYCKMIPYRKTVGGFTYWYEIWNCIKHDNDESQYTVFKFIKHDDTYHKLNLGNTITLDFRV